MKNGSPLFVPSLLSKHLEQAKGDFELILIILYSLSLKPCTADTSLRVRLLTMSVVERADCAVSWVRAFENCKTKVLTFNSWILSSKYSTFFFCRGMEQSSSTLLMVILLGMPTSQAWWQMVHGVITWFYRARQTALKHAFTWLAVCRIAMTLWSAQSMMLLVATDLCWVTCTSFTMLVLFHVKEVRLSNVTII